ncbi:MAG TPA: A/G-specific adenine glycosylase [Acidimicrobiales bacterium]|nr:A/G-specific adenine glycosylase [Acidimicrobiales bacterium]
MSAHRLIAWAAVNGRDLPWRHTRDPWAILVSEVMLQQTQVARVVPVWRAFLERFPTAPACAAAPQSDVVTAWRGMGYNRRAVSLHRCAIAVTADHAGRVPDDLDALLALPGIGAYTARAVLAFAYERAVGVLDVNAARVHARLAGAPVDQTTADAAAPSGQAWAWNQAILDLGATICTKRQPRCGDCPLSDDCAWHRAGPDPAPARTRQSKFEGSDRQGRGRLVDALRLGAVSADPADLAEIMGWPGDTKRAQRVALSVVADGLADWADNSLTLCLRQ